MARITDVFVSQPTFYNHKAPIIDIKRGGQFGHMMDYTSLVSSTPYVRQHLVAILLEAPRGFKYMERPEIWNASLKAIIEEQSKSITGLTSTLSLENVDNAVGGAGEQISAISNVTREPSRPVHSIDEKYNMSVATFMNSWILELMMDPETKYPNIITRGNVRTQVTDHLVDFYGATVLYFEPDPLFRHVIKAWLCYYVRPADQGAPIEGSRDLTSGKEGLTIDITMSATSQIGYGPIELAQKILDTLNVTNANPHQRPAPIDQVSADVRAITDSGYAEGLSNAAKMALQL